MDLAIIPALIIAKYEAQRKLRLHLVDNAADHCVSFHVVFAPCLSYGHSPCPSAGPFILPGYHCLWSLPQSCLVDQDLCFVNRQTKNTTKKGKVMCLRAQSSQVTEFDAIVFLDSSLWNHSMFSFGIIPHQTVSLTRLLLLHSDHHHLHVFPCQAQWEESVPCWASHMWRCLSLQQCCVYLCLPYVCMCTCVNAFSV